MITSPISTIRGRSEREALEPAAPARGDRAAATARGTKPSPKRSGTLHKAKVRSTFALRGERELEAGAETGLAAEIDTTAERERELARDREA